MQIYEDIINLQLLWQMKEMITGLINKQRCEERISLFGENKPQLTMEEMYGFRYPGEVLERYREKCGDTQKNLRALAIALSEMKDVLEDNMFIGNQKTIFINQVRSQADEDIYLRGALYLLTNRKAEKKALEERLKQYAPSSTHEFIYLQSLLLMIIPGYAPDIPKCNYFLGENRTLKVYGNEDIYAWFLNHFAGLIKKYRKRDCDVLKALMQLPCRHIKKEDMIWNRLKNSGYSEQEIIYLNMKLPQLAEVKGHLWTNSITMERIAAQGCLYILNSEHVESSYLYELVLEYLILYKEFSIQLQECRGLSKLLKDKVSIRDKNLFLYLYPNKKSKALCINWFFIDLTEECWDTLSESFTEEAYRDLFESSFCYYSNGREAQWLKKYEEVYKESYICQFWKKKNSYSISILHKLVQTGHFDLNDYLEKYAEDRKNMNENALQEKWKYMLSHIAIIVKKMDSYEIFCFWKSYDRLFGMEALRAFTGRQNIVSDAINYQIYSYSTDREKLWKNLDFLSEDEKRMLFFWECDELYLHYPKQYNDFLIKFLLETGIELFSKKQCNEWLNTLMPSLNSNSWTTDQLRNMYYSSEELEAYQKQIQQHKEDEEIKRQQRWRQELQEAMDFSETEYSRLAAWSDSIDYYHSSRVYYEIAYSCLLEELEKGNCMVKCSQMGGILKSMAKIMTYKVIGWNELRELINRLEVVKDESL